MNPEIRFRVPEHVHRLAGVRAKELGLRQRRGRTGGASELARCALYTFLGLGLPDETELADGTELNRVRATRDSLDDSELDALRVTVYHRVCPEFRKERGLEGRSVAARVTTEFRFLPGELPDFLVPYVLLTELGNPFISLNLEGPLSPRKKSLGELTTAAEKATLSELRECLTDIATRKRDKERERRQQEEQLEKGLQQLRTWSLKQGSELLVARLEGSFEWTELACREYALHELSRLGLHDLTFLPTTQTLESISQSYINIRPQKKPCLETLQVYNRLRELGDAGLEFHIVMVDDSRSGGTLEGVQISFKLPIPGRLHFLTQLHPLNERG